jgi:hypothetical protein
LVDAKAFTLKLTLSVRCREADVPQEAAANMPAAKLTFGRDPNLRKEDYMVKNQQGKVVTRAPGFVGLHIWLQTRSVHFPQHKFTVQ